MKSNIIRKAIHLGAQFPRSEWVAFTGFEISYFSVLAGDGPTAGIRAVVVASAVGGFCFTFWHTG
jgi:hypothetical protein